MGSDEPFFLVGCPRSGTTLLRELLASHPRLAIPPESHFIPDFFRAYGDPRGARDARALGRLMIEFERVRSWRLREVSVESFADDRTYAAAVSRLFAAFAAQEGKPRWGDKTPHYVAEMETLARVFPHARFVHIVRDGRDVALSWLRTRMEPGNVYVAARMWRDLVRAGLRSEAHLKGRVLTIRYERLLERTEEVMRAVCEHIGEEYSPAVLNPTVRRFGPPRLHTRRQPRPRSEVVRADNSCKWRSEMSVRDRRVFEAAAGDLLRELGYETGPPALPPGALARAAYEVDHVVRWASVRVRSPRALTLLSEWWQRTRARTLGATRRSGSAEARP
jgi:hypothetical protein